MLGAGTPSTAKRPAQSTSMLDPQRPAGITAVLGEVFEAGDRALPFESGGGLGRQRLEQAAGTGADPEREVRGGGARHGADVLPRDRLRLGQRRGALRIRPRLPPALV